MNLLLSCLAVVFCNSDSQLDILHMWQCDSVSMYNFFVNAGKWKQFLNCCLENVPDITDTLLMVSFFVHFSNNHIRVNAWIQNWNNSFVMFWMFMLPCIIILLKVYRFIVFVSLLWYRVSILTSMVSQGTFFLQYWQGVGLFEQSEVSCKLRSPFVICSPQPWLQSRSLLGHSSTCFCKKYVCHRSNIRNAHDAAMRRWFLV